MWKENNDQILVNSYIFTQITLFTYTFVAFYQVSQGSLPREGVHEGAFRLFDYFLCNETIGAKWLLDDRKQGLSREIVFPVIGSRVKGLPKMPEPAFLITLCPALLSCYVFRLIVTKKNDKQLWYLSIILSYICVCKFFVIIIK